MSDYIKREDAINAVADQMAFEASMETGNDYMGADYSDDAKEWLSGCPSADRPQGWIPCSERLPSEKGMYLVTSREKATAEEFGFDLDDIEVKKMRFNEDGWRIPKHIPEWINGVVHTTVLAWMPLPEPWKGADDED